MSQGQDTPRRTRGADLKVIDFHVHVVDDHVMDVSTNYAVITGFGAQKRPVRPVLDAKLREIPVQLADMADRGVTQSVLLHSTVHQPTTWAEPALERALAARMNDLVANWVRAEPSRFIGSLIPPLVDVEAGLEEIERAAALGLRVVEIPARVGDDYMGAPRFRPFWALVERLKLVTFIHPDGTRDPWFQNFSTWNSIGQSIEETKVMTSLIYEGTLDRFPDAAIVMAHGGGYMPHNMGRLDRNTRRPESMLHITKAPSEYLRRFHYDTCMYDPFALRNLVERVGADRLVTASDYPFGEWDPLAAIAALPNVSDADLALIAHGNAERLLGL